MGRELSDEEASSLGLPVAPPRLENAPLRPAKRELSDEEANHLGLNETPPDEGPSWLSSMGHKLVNGFLKGGSDESQGVVAAATNVDPANARFRQPDGTMKAAGTREGVYRAGRDMERHQLEQASEKHPWSSFGAEVLGDVGSDAALQALGVPVTSRAYQTVLGGLTGLLSSNAELTPEKSTPGDVGSAALATGAGAAGAYYIPKIGSRIANKYAGSALEKFIEKKIPGGLAKFAENRAVKAAEPMLADYRGMARKDKLQEVGRDLLDQGVVRAGRGLKDVASRSEKVAGEQGDLIRKYLGQFDQAAEGAASTNMPRVDTGALGQRIESELIAPMRGSPAFDGLVPDLARRTELIKGAGDELSYAEANKMKSAIDEFVNHSKEQSPALEKLKGLRGILNSEIEQRAQSVAPEVFPKWKEAKRLFGNMKDVADFSADKLSRNSANRFLSPTDHAAAIGGAVAAGPLGLALGAVNNLARHRGNSTLAVGADQLGKAWAQKLPALLQAGGKELGKYGPVLMRELQRNGMDGALAVDHALEKEDPEYAARKQALLQEGQ